MKHLIDFRATSITKAFILNAIATSLIAVFAVEFKSFLEKRGWLGESEAVKGIIVLILTFGVAIVVYVILYFIFGYGGGMLTNPISKRKQRKKYYL